MTDFTKSETNICNLALQQMGRPITITSMSDTSTPGLLCARQYPISRDAVLQAYPWNFAKRRASITEYVTAPAFEFAHQYRLPTDYLGGLKIFDNDDAVFKLEGYVVNTTTIYQMILTDLGSPLQVIYTAQVTDATTFPALFIITLAAHIAAEISQPLTESGAKTQGLWSVYQQKLREARAVDAADDVPDQMPQGNWVTERISGGVSPYKDFIP